MDSKQEITPARLYRLAYGSGLLHVIVLMICATIIVAVGQAAGVEIHGKEETGAKMEAQRGTMGKMENLTTKPIESTMEGFRYCEITDECKAAGGKLSVAVQAYTYYLCRQQGVAYEMVIALIERESKCVSSAEGDNGESIGLMQIQPRQHKERLDRLGVTNLYNPYQNIRVGVDILAEIKGTLQGIVPDEELPYYVLAAYNCGMRGAKENLWDKGITRYEYNEEIMARTEQLREAPKCAEPAEEGRIL